MTAFFLLGFREAKRDGWTWILHWGDLFLPKSLYVFGIRVWFCCSVLGQNFQPILYAFMSSFSSLLFQAIHLCMHLLFLIPCKLSNPVVVMSEFILINFFIFLYFAGIEGENDRCWPHWSFTLAYWIYYNSSQQWWCKLFLIFY